MTELTLSVSILVASVERPLSCIYAVMASTPVSYRTDKAGVGIASVVNRILLCYFDKKTFLPFPRLWKFPGSQQLVAKEL